MSTLTARSAAVLHLAQIDATECGKCGHPLSQHSISLRVDGTPCREWHWKYREDGTIGKQIQCKCKRFVDPSEQLPIGDPK